MVAEIVALDLALMNCWRVVAGAAPAATCPPLRRRGSI